MAGSTREGDVDLADIRRPAYFGHKPYEEPIGKAEGRAYTIELTVPRDSFERIHLGRRGPGQAARLVPEG